MVPLSMMRVKVFLLSVRANIPCATAPFPGNQASPGIVVVRVERLESLLIQTCLMGEKLRQKRSF